MLQLTKGIENSVIVTLTESVTIDNPFFLFVFYNTERNETLKKLFSSSDDQSTSKERYNEFLLPSGFFSSSQVGQWSFEVYEQASSSNLDETQATKIETGIIQLSNAEATTVKKYTPEKQTKKVYNG
jgi:hypothetical protein